VFAVGFAVSVIATARSEFAARQASLAGYNLVIHAGGAQVDSVRGKLTLESLPAVHERITVPVEALESGGQLLWMRHLQIEGRADPSWDLTLEGEPWGSIENGVYLPSEMKDRIALGDEVTVQMAGGERAALKIAGFYAYKPVESIAERARSPIVRAELARTLSAGESPVIFVAEVPVERLADVTESLAEALPDAMVLSAYEVADALESAIQNLFVFAVAVAGLALVAGAVLIANAVGLAMVERRREIGVLKAVGYGSSDVLAALLMEYGLLGLLAGILGTGGVAVAIQILNILEPRAQLGFDLPSASLVALAAVLVAVISAALAGWGPSHMRPLVVLREE
jgi:putative ABC transport system permease protein